MWSSYLFMNAFGRKKCRASIVRARTVIAQALRRTEEQLRLLPQSLKIPQTHCKEEGQDKKQQHRDIPVRMNAEPPDDEESSCDCVGTESDVKRRPSAIQQKIVEMSAVARKGRNPIPQATYHRQEKIHQRQRRE